MRIGVEEAYFKELVEVGANSAFGYLQTVDSRCIKSGITIDFDAINPLQNEYTLRDIFVIDTRNVYHGIIFEHLFEMVGVLCLAHVVYFFIHRSFELVVATHEIKELVLVDEAGDDPDDKLEGEQVHTYEPVTMG